MTSSVYDIAIIGGGIVGLAVAHALALRHPGLRMILLEKEHRMAMHQTGRNSGVIHSGVYYRPGSLKATTCVRGRELLLAFAAEHGIPHAVCGKLIVATDGRELPYLHTLYERGCANGVPGLSLIGEQEIRTIEPHCRGVQALHVPGAGSIDYTRTATVLADLLRTRFGATIHTGHRVVHIASRHGEKHIRTQRASFRSRALIGCAGLHADRIARLDGLMPSVRIVGFRGDYYRLADHADHMVRALIYPIPDPQFPFLGVHFTRMIGGGVECGPNAVFSFKREGYSRSDIHLRDTVEALSYRGLWRLFARHWRAGLDEYRRAFSQQRFLASLQRLLPALRMEDILPERAGVRAVALAPDGSLADDFAVERGSASLHVLSAPSPAATACLAIGENVCTMAVEHFGW